MNATYYSTESYLIKKKNLSGKEEKKGGAAAISRHYFDIAEALMKEMVASNIILFATVPKFCLQLYPNSDHQTRVKDKVLSDLHRQH